MDHGSADRPLWCHCSDDHCLMQSLLATGTFYILNVKQRTIAIPPAGSMKNGITKQDKIALFPK